MTPNEPFRWARTRARERRESGLRRQVRPRDPAGGGLLDLASNDYLGLTRHPAVVRAAARSAYEWGAGSTGSRLVTGSTTLHADLERALAQHCGASAALVFSSGYLANQAAVAALTGPDALVVSDAQNHASIVDACRLSRARVVVVPHRDVAAVRAALATRAEERAVVVTDAVFSVDGDTAPLRGMAAATRAYGAGLIVDEAHALGVVGPQGRGATYEAGLAGAADIVVTVTLSKSLGAQGGAVVATTDVVEHLVDAARTFIFDTGLAPACAGAALAALELLGQRPELADLARSHAAELSVAAREVGLEATVPGAAVTSVLIGSPSDAVAAAEVCAAEGVRVGCFRPPSVPDGVSRLRLTARADLSDENIRLARKALAAVASVVP